MAKLLLAILILNIISTFDAQASTRHVCGSHTFGRASNARELKYCIDYGDRRRNKDILYVLHGSNGSEQDWVTTPDNIATEKAWAKRGIPAPTKITFSFGDEWMFADIVHTPEAQSYSQITKQVIPYLESLIPGKITHRYLKGISMGGWNGVQLLLKNSELFDRVALICPVISSLGPFSTHAEVEEYIAQGKYLNRQWIEDLVQEEKNMFVSKQEWAQHNPLTLVNDAEIKTPHVYLSCGDTDQYGFFEGTKMFAQKLMTKNVNVIWSPQHGGHCTVDADEVARFFAP